MRNQWQKQTYFNFDFRLFDRQQYQAFKDAGRNVDNMPLVQVQDVMKYMPQLTYMVQNQEQTPAKRSRIS